MRSSGRLPAVDSRPVTTLLPKEVPAVSGKAKKKRSTPRIAEIDGEVMEFIAALDRFKDENSRPFPSWSEVLQVLKGLGYDRRG